VALRNRQLAALALFGALAVLHSWPLAGNPGGLARLDNDDAALNTWVIAWVAHVLPRDPLGLFDAPIFHPERHTLAYSEHLFVPSLIGAPLLWAGLSPVLVHNLLLMAGLALSGWAMYLLLARWTGSQWAGVTAGMIYAFNAHTLTRFAHLQAHHVEFFPLLLYAVDRVIVAPKMRQALLLAAAFTLQALCGNYLLVFATFSLVVAVAVRWPEIGSQRGAAVIALLAAGLVSLVLLAPFLWPYYQVSRDAGLTRSLDEVAHYSAGWRDYLVTGGRLHYAMWSSAFWDGRTALFPGITALILAMVAIGSRPGWRDPRVRMAIAVGVLGVAFSFGTALPGYSFLHELVPLLGGIRNAARWGWLALAAIAVLAGFGMAALARPNRSGWQMVPALVCVLVTVEAIRTPVGFTPFTGIPAIYDRLANEPDAVVAEFPFYSGGSVSQNGPYVLANTRYFKPLLNGYSGFQTAAFEARGRALDAFPGESALAELRAAGVTHVLVHTAPFSRRYGPQTLAAIDAAAALQLEIEQDGIRLYRFK
jgi:hypothetical protein